MGLMEPRGGIVSGTCMSLSGQQLYKRARQRIPGATQLLSKRSEHFLPDQWPSYYSAAKGVDVWDLDGNRFIDMAYSGVGACILGFSDPDVDEAVHTAVRAGSMCTLNCPEEIELADLLCELHPWADMVRYARCGGEAMAIAVRGARARTRRDKIAFCGYHGWHDWYLAANLSGNEALVGHLLPGLEPLGVPRSLNGTALPFRYNDMNQIEELVSTYGNELAAIVMEPVRHEQPERNFLHRVQQIATQIGAVLIFDEITSGWRLNTGGAHLIYGVAPDMAVFAKAISNGYPMAAVIGKSSVMEAFENTFVSSTYWTEKIGPTAALATIRKHRNCKVWEHLIEIGALVQSGWRELAVQHRLAIKIDGILPSPHFTFEYPNSQTVRTLFTQIMLDAGFLATNTFYATYAHQRAHVDSYLKVVDRAFGLIAVAIAQNEVENNLRGPVAHAGFYRLN
jgi:glutamate-1-semialdehyde 2,1-aminomutase